MAKIIPERDKKKLSINVHPAAKAAFDFFNGQAYLFDKTLFSIDALRTLNQYSTLHAVEQKKSRVLVFSGFEFFGFDLSNTDFRKCTIIVHRDLTEEDIRFQAWVNVTRTLLSSLQPQHIESFRRHFNQSAPNEIVQFLIKRNKISQPQLAKWTSLSRSGLARQKSREASISKPQPQLSIFEKLLKESTDESERS
ncbi:hypothetical protein BIZ37_04190 [Photobacterium sp. BZF1]|uniref:hypothetical protein n=1 Tax=Photobacterium sp. BZF1 TaxID=1904457 RepID=UPI0016538F6A|nr:hypothetical protein [Photobacterium sp. BZF1]MBC7001743.1 hypothetical protein [Photobacterium sp. BZF1]